MIPVYSFVQDCIKQTGENAVYELSLTGGYYNVPKLKTDNNIPYYFYNSRKYIPTKKTIEKQISLYIDDNLDDCINGFNNFNDFEIERKTIKTTSKIDDNSILFNVKYPITLVKAENTYHLENFQTEVKLRLGTIFNSASELIKEQATHPTSICLTCINDIAKKNDIYFEVNYPDKQTIIFIILDNRTIINNKTLIYEFAYDLK